MTDIGNSELANERIEQTAARAEEILKAPSERLAPAALRLGAIISDATRRAPLQSLMVAFLLGIVIARRR
jgi:hypothetical protein